MDGENYSFLTFDYLWPPLVPVCRALECRGVDPWRAFYRVLDKTVTVELIGQKKGNILLIEGKEFKL